MGFHKYSFPIRMIDTYETPIKVVTGWVNEDYSIGFHKIRDGKAWVATDICTGTRFCTATTRKGCVEWINKNEQRIIKKREELSYIQRVLDFKEILKKELDSYT